MKKKQRNLVGMLLLAVIGLYSLNLIGFFEKDAITLAVVSDCPGNALCKESQTPFSCPPDVDFCQVQGSIDCLSSTGIQRVVFRKGLVNEIQTHPTYPSYSREIAVDSNGDGQLERYTYAQTLSGNMYGDILGFKTPEGYSINVRKGYKCDVAIFIVPDSRAYCYILGGDIESSNLPLESYSSNNLEVYLGSKPYSCGSTFQILKNDGTIKDFQIIEYSDSNQWEDRRTSKIFRLEKGEIAEFKGGTYTGSRVFYNENVIKQTCSRDYCEGGNIRLCENGVPGKFQTCEFGCLNGFCISPFDVDIKIRDSRGFQTDSIGKNNPFSITLNIQSSSVFSEDVNFELRRGGIEGDSYYSQKKSFTTNTPLLFNFPEGIPITDKYYIVLKVNYPNSIQPITYGLEGGEYNTLNIVDEFSSNLRLSQILGDVERRNNFFVGYPIKVEYIFQEGGDSPSLPDSVTISYSVGSSKINLNNPTIFTDNTNGYYLYEFTPTQSGQYTFNAQANRGDFSTPLISETYSVTNDQIVTDYNLFYDQVVTNKNYNKLLSWTTKNRDGKLIETTNSVLVRINGVNSGNVPVFGSNGNYYIDYIFTKDNADYIFIIKSESSIIGLTSSEISTELIKSGLEEETTCTIGSCGFFEECNPDTGVCETKISMIFFVFGGILGLMIILIIILRLRKSKARVELGVGL